MTILLDKLSSKNENVVMHATTCLKNILEDPKAMGMFCEHGAAEVLSKLQVSASSEKQ